MSGRIVDKRYGCSDDLDALAKIFLEQTGLKMPMHCL